MLRSRPAIREAPEPSVQSGTWLPPSGDTGARLLESITELVAKARTSSDPHRAAVVGTIHSELAKLPREAAPEAGAALLHRLLEEGLLEGLADEDGLPTAIVATRTLLDLGYPHALEVSPERLEALRAWSRPTLPVPWLALSLTLFLAYIVQIAFVTLGAPGMNTFGMSADALAGLEPPEQTWVDTLSSAVWDSAGSVLGGQVLANFLAFLAAVTVGGRARARPWVQRFFFGIGALGLLVGGVQFVASGWLTCGTFVSAAGSLVCGWLLRQR